MSALPSQQAIAQWLLTLGDMRSSIAAATMARWCLLLSYARAEALASGGLMRLERERMNVVLSAAREEHGEEFAYAVAAACGVDIDELLMDLREDTELREIEIDGERSITPRQEVSDARVPW